MTASSAAIAVAVRLNLDAVRNRIERAIEAGLPEDARVNLGFALDMLDQLDALAADTLASVSPPDDRAN